MDPDCCKPLPLISYEARIREEMRWYQEENKDGITAHEATLPLEEKQWRSETSHLQTRKRRAKQKLENPKPKHMVPDKNNGCNPR